MIALLLNDTNPSELPISYLSNMESLLKQLGLPCPAYREETSLRTNVLHTIVRMCWVSILCELHAVVNVDMTSRSGQSPEKPKLTGLGHVECGSFLIEQHGAVYEPLIVGTGVALEQGLNSPRPVLLGRI